MSFTNTHRALDDIRTRAIEDVKSDFDGLIECYNEYNESEEWKPVAEFIARVVDWHADKTKTQWLYEMFRYVFPTDPVGFAGALGSFVGNAIMDDSCFVIHWRKPDYLLETLSYEFGGKKIEFTHKELQYENGEIKMQSVSKDDPDGVPEIEWGNDSIPDVSQDVALLMEAMDIFEVRQNARTAKLEKFAADIEERRKAHSGK